MKKYLPYLLILVTLVLLILVISNNSKKVLPKIITLNTLHTYFYHSDEQISIVIYTNDSSAPLDDIRAYQSIKVSSSDSSKSMTLNLVEVSYSHSEYFMQETYYSYNLVFSIPNLTSNYEISEAYLELTLLNNAKYSLKIGEFSILYFNEYEELDWVSLDSKKDNPSNYYLSEIVVELKSKLNIKKVTVDYNNELSFYLNQNVLTISLNNKSLINYNVPIIIEDTSGNYYIIYNHHYVKEYDLLNLAKELVNIYDFS